MSQKLTLKDDIMFKAFFSRNEKYLKSFLSAIMGKEIKIKKVMHDARLEQLTKEMKYGILDLEVELEGGEIVNIEMQLKDNKIYPCYTVAYIEHVNKYFNTNFEQQKEDYIELNHVITKKEFKKIRKKAIPFCKYCDMKNAKDVKWAISKKSRNEWIK